MQLYLIRHAQSYNNALEDSRNRVQDPDLSDIGFEQARLLGEYLKDAVDMGQERPIRYKPMTFTHLYVSPMKRTLQTAQPIAEALGMTPHIWTDIHEIGGIFLADDEGNTTGFGGLTRTEIATTFKGYVIPEHVTDKGWWKPDDGQETPANFLSRAIRVALDLRSRASTDDVICLVSHAAFLDALVKALLNQAPTHPDDLFYLHFNTGITRFDFLNPYGRLRMTYFNRTTHLPATMQTS